MAIPLQVLIIEDVESDAELCFHHLVKTGFAVTYERVETADALKTALKRPGWDVIISDYSLPGFSAPAALQIFHESGLDIPFIVVSGTITEETAIGLMRAGASDYLMKDRLARLGPLVKRELNVTQVRRERNETQAGLNKALEWSNLIYNATSDVMFLIALEPDGVYRCVTVNAAFYKGTGYTPDEVIGRRLEEILKPATVPFYFGKYQAAIQSGQPVQYEESIDLPQGVVIFSTTITPILDAAGRCTHLLGSSHEITDYKRAERMIRESEEKFRQLVERSSEIFYRQNLASGRFEYISPTVMDKLGYTPEEWLGLDVEQQTEKIHPEDLSMALNFYQDLLQADARGEKFIERDFRILHKQGGYRWIHGNYALIRAADHSPLCVVGSLGDITQHKEIETQLSTTRILLEQTYLQSPVPMVLVTEPDRTLRIVNAAAAEFLGIDVDAYVNHSLNEVSIPWKNIDAAGQEIASADLPLVLALKGITTRNREILVQHRNGIRRWQMVSGAPIFNPEGRLLGGLIVFPEITQRKLAEEALRQNHETAQSILNAVAETVFLMNVDGIVIMANEMAAARLGKRVEDLTGANIFDFVSPEMAERRKHYVEIVVRERIPHHFEDRRGEIWLDSTVYPILDNDGQIRRVVIYGRDITERKQAEAAMLDVQLELRNLLAETERSRRALLSLVEDQRAAEEYIRRLNTELERRVAERTAQLTAANRELEAFSYSVSHDLRAPLRALDGFSHVLLDIYADQLDEEGRHYLARIQESTRRMGQLIDDLLNLSRITRADFARQPVNLSTLAEEIAAELRAQSPQRQVQCEIAGDLKVQGDRNLLKILMENLLNNAFKFTNQREQALIQVGRMEQGGRPIYFVRDNGAGFNMEYADKLFTPFQRLHGAHEFSGTGIGLTIVQRIITRHQGRIWPEATAGLGATFYFTLWETE